MKYNFIVRVLSMEIIAHLYSNKVKQNENN